eukprot:3765397-Rhodomonas_salina.2
MRSSIAYLSTGHRIARPHSSLAQYRTSRVGMGQGYLPSRPPLLSSGSTVRYVSTQRLRRVMAGLRQQHSPCQYSTRHSLYQYCTSPICQYNTWHRSIAHFGTARGVDSVHRTGHGVKA